MIELAQQTPLNGRSPRSRRSVHDVLVSGSSGLVGQALLARLAEQGRDTTRLVRSAPSRGQLSWDPEAGTLDASSIDADAVVHLAGESIAEGRWSRRKLEAIRASRVQGTRLLCESLAGLAKPPAVLVSASAVGFYGDGGSRQLVESSASGTGFLAEVCREWEAATLPAREAGIRVVNLRIGVVLARTGGALSKLLLPFRLGLGGRIGSGEQYMSWILLDDLVSVICTALDDEGLAGPVNATAPGSVTNREFTRALGAVLRRPTLASVPAFAARAAFGRMADELLLASQRVQPAKLLERGFTFEEPHLEGALRAALEG